MGVRILGVRRVTHAEDLQREAAYWASKTLAERVIAGWALAEDDLLARESDESKERTTWILRRVVRRGR